MQWTVVNFGKHKGLTLPQILFKDADWFFYAYEQGYFKSPYTREARVLYRRARSIRVPERNGQKMFVRYITHQSKRTGTVKFGTMELIADGPGLERLNVSQRIDFYTPRSYAQYDKTGYKNFVSALKAILPDKLPRRMNQQACEDFFAGDDNFDLD